MIIPAIDLIEGKVVRLYQGDYEQTTEYKLDPIDVVNQYADDGAQWLHIVDLTGAKDTAKRQLQLISDMVATKRMRFQSGGGVRTKADVQGLLNAGVERVVIGSLAVTQPELVEAWMQEFGPEHIVLALDINIDEQGNKFVATHGWQKDSGVSIETLIKRYSKVGLQHVLCTDISRDGTLQGANDSLYSEVAKQFPDIQWQASGGIGNLKDIEVLKPTNVAGVILGRALLEGKFTVKEAIACWQD
ncbi:MULTISPECIES: 1-(5-phosphoribosyl)-5-[(5-phosphoribosylamino)methylideneamino]imidazole-4-carboxamide isomerase [Alteromonadaceae]|jgi:phosphoribosylformimino-5-aminoimidazole carboxamide ribotide isomerase|uniref:1-(5-phosphoribosyl)-5-[(5-phosphoribosylamino)methylideneamino] imidazole-4-carboxamide isomerase n=1 Tax=Brumicola blandensis TaxID=3075611 RepID=A0AAW8QV25_9ALTE|nr:MULTISPECIES: 1-(5-phosphoribosyl)-5-[(5-phosphoribosylamino)methylideneamino]imidazole-4-carboxamide isomerase [unclassified Alteromonas]MDT0580946.1 1-(5-phosphoribosyl)-5-[(5-phosphoribosylamino)methylideneamino]imidazole-4-carboxamide isomerase [Alteromonas sp. W409]MDT0629625.1 1-(5-phosphoribosyl)-5-[(5-phosphoribosylamino)methylideneamino]imidazole-4-carboxamide isomerase [Alteromonas sp. W364]